jgi:hypothetical protein
LDRQKRNYQVVEMSKQEIGISHSFIRKAALIYITLPLFCFLIGWLKVYFAIPAVLALLVGLFFAFRKQKKEEGEDVIRMPRFMPFVIVALSFTYAFFCGVGRFWAQSKDYPWRNAIFRDLILRDWPVLYPKYKGALVYYIGQWLPAALPGKLARLFGAGEDVAFLVGNIALLVYITIGLSILFILLISYFKPKKIGAIFLVMISFIFFSGMDIIASLEPLGVNNYHLEWWAVEYQYSSITTCMCWVFNQSLIPWICMALLLKEKNISQYVLIGMACLLSGPFPFVGYFIYAMTMGVMKLIPAVRDKKVGEFMKALFSPSNILSALLVFPFIGVFFLSNTAVTNAGGLVASNAVENLGKTTTLAQALWIYIKFILLEFGIYAILIARKYWKNPLYYVTIVSLLVFPFFKMGYSTDFTMRASIPAIFMMYIFCLKFLMEEKDEVLIGGEGVVAVNPVGVKTIKEATLKTEDKESKKEPVKKELLFNMHDLKRYAFAALVICMILGAATPTVEFIRGIRQVSMRGIDDKMTDFLYTLGGDGPYDREKQEPEYNFVAINLDNQLFFKYFSKETIDE